MNNRLIFMPGGGCQVREHYPKTYERLVDAGFDVVPLVPEWEDSFEDVVAQVGSDVSRHIGRGGIILAHSRGANVVMPVLESLQNVGVILASPSVSCAEGYDSAEGRRMIRENYPNQDAQLKRVGMRALAMAAHASGVNATIMVGEQEVKSYPFIQDIAEATAEGFNTTPLQVPDAPHFIDYHENYITAVVDEALHFRT